MKYFLQHIVTNFKWPIAIMLLAVCIVFWITAFSISWKNTLPSLLLCIFNAVLLSRVCFRVNITRNFSLLPAIICFLPFSVLPQITSMWQTQLLGLAMLLVSMQLLDIYRADAAVNEVFVATVIFSLSALITPETLLLIAVLILYMIIQQSFNIKVLLAICIAIALCAVYYFLQQHLLSSPLTINWEVFIERKFINFQSGVTQFVFTITIAALYVIFDFVLFIGFSSYNIHSQSFLVYFSLPVFILLPLILYKSEDISPIIGMLIASMGALASQFFYRKQSIATGVVLLLYLSVFIGLGVFNIIYTNFNF